MNFFHKTILGLSCLALIGMQGCTTKSDGNPLVKYGDPDEITILNYEEPSEALGGLTPFQVAQEAYRQHLTQQQWSDFFVYDFGHPQDSHRYGLFRSLVGPDIDKNDLMEHVSREAFPLPEG